MPKKQSWTTEPHLDCTRLHNQSKRSEDARAARLTLTEEKLTPGNRRAMFLRKGSTESHNMKANVPFIALQNDTEVVDLKEVALPREDMQVEDLSYIRDYFP